MAFPSPVTSKPMTHSNATHENVLFQTLGINNFSRSYRLLNQKQFGNSFSEFGKGFAKCLGLALIIYGIIPSSKVNSNVDSIEGEITKLNDCINNYHGNCRETLVKYLSLSAQNPAIACAATHTKTCEKIIGLVGNLDKEQFHGIRGSVVESCISKPDAIPKCKNLLDKVLDEEFKANSTDTIFNILYSGGKSYDNAGAYNFEVAEEYFQKIVTQEPINIKLLDAFLMPCMKGFSNSITCQLTMNYAFNHFLSINHHYAKVMKDKCIEQVLPLEAIRIPSEKRNLACEGLLELPCEQLYKNDPEMLSICVKDDKAFAEALEQEKKEKEKSKNA